MKNINSYPRRLKLQKPKLRIRLFGIFGNYIMTEEKKRHALAFDLKHALTNLEFLHSHSDETLDAFANWLLLTYFDYVEASLLKEAILFLPSVERTEKPVAINELLEISLSVVLEQGKSWNSLLGWTAAKLADNANVEGVDPRLISTIGNLPGHVKDKLIKEIRYGNQDGFGFRRHSPQRLQKPEQPQKHKLVA